MEKKPFYIINAAQGKKTVDIFLMGPIESWNKNVDPNGFAANFMAKCSKASTVRVWMHTPGGDVFGGNAIYNTLKSYKGNLEFYNIGVVASMGSIIYQVPGAKRYMASNSRMMIHPPSGGCYGQAAELEATAKLLKSLNADFKKQLKANTGATDTQVNEWLSGPDQWFTAQEAIDAKLCDGICDEISADVEIEKEVQELGADAVYERFAAHLQIPDLDTEPEPEPSFPQTTDMKKIFAVLALADANATEEAAVVAIQAQKLDIQAKDQEITALKKERDEYKAKLDAATALEKDTKATILVESAIKDGKIAAGQKDQYLELAKANYDTVKTILDGKSAQTSVFDQVTKGQAPGASAELTWDDYYKDPKKSHLLAKMRTENWAQYEALYEARFGLKPKKD